MKKRFLIPACVLAAAAIELCAVFFLVKSVIVVFPEGWSNWYLPLALALNCVALFLNAAHLRKNKKE